MDKMSFMRHIKNIVTKTNIYNSVRTNSQLNLSTSVAELTTNADKDEPVWHMENPYQKEKKLCVLCKYNIIPDYKNYKLLSQFQSPYTGRIYGKHITGLCQTKQELVQKEIVKAQNCGFMPYYNKDKSFLKDPKLFDPEKPLRPHRF